MSKEWLKHAVIYQIYPQSFFDTNGDGIGDINGISEKLDYIRELGCDLLWINPCFDSPFHDAGYDVRDYKKVAPRYGANDDLRRLFREAHGRGIRVLLDLVPGHTSEEHPWFIASSKAEHNEYSNRYIWTDSCFRGAEGMPFIGGERERNGCYILNFFKCQPALNYGFQNPKESWQLPPTHPDCVATLEAMKDVMRFWLSMGCDGFRVDMAASLIKRDDENRTGIKALWKNVRSMLDREFPDAVLISEWSDPPKAIDAGFDIDFYLHSAGNGCSALLRDYQCHGNGKPGGEDHSYFKKDGKGDVTPFLEEFCPWYEKTKGRGYISFQTGTHDTERARWSLTEEELKIAYAVLFTLPGIPSVYYGDEIGMRYLEVPTKEGGYNRTGSRTPMQWKKAPNLGFSEGTKESLYLPVDSADDAPTAEEQMRDPDSLWNTVKRLLALRRAEDDLSADAPFEVLFARKGSPLFVYRRGSLTIAVNPSAEPVSEKVCGAEKIVYAMGNASVKQGTIGLGPQSFLIAR